MLSKFLDPKNDVAFKKIFGSEKNKDILIHFLNDMLVFKNKLPIKSVAFLKTIQDPEIAAKKTSIVDIMCTDEQNNKYIVEMQIAKEKGFIKRAQYYAAKAYCSQLKIGDKYQDLKEVIFLAITDFIMFPDKPEFKSDHIILDKENLEHDLKDFSFTFLELGKFNKNPTQLSNIIDKWAYFFKHAEETTSEELFKIINNEWIIKRAYEELNHFNWSSEELMLYEEAVKKQMDYDASMDQRYDEGIEIGKKQGIDIGKQQGIDIGKQQGIDIGGKLKAKEIATKLLNEGISINAVANITGITIQEIIHINNKIKINEKN